MTKIKPALWVLYIVENRYGHWYTGITNNLLKRIRAHQQGTGAKALRGKGPLRLIYSLEVGDKSDAAKLEYQFKQLTKVRKKAWLIQQLQGPCRVPVQPAQPD